MRQKKLGNILYVMSQSPYKITEDLDVSIIYIDTNLYDEYVKLNQSLDLTRYNYLLLRKSDPPYWPYVNAKEERDFDFDTLTFNVSSYLDENKTMTLQELSVPEDFDGEIKYYLDGVELDSSTFVLENASIYTVSAITSNSSIYEDDTNSVYSIIYEKFKRDCTLSFDTSSYNVTSYIDETYTGTLQTVNNVPENVLVKYYLNNNLLNSSTYTISNPGTHKITAAIENDSLYNDTSVSYLVNYTKEKRNAVLSFANTVVDVSVEDVTSYSGQVQSVSEAPSGVSINYYLGNTLLTNGQIEISDLEEGENTFTIYAKIENDPVYNNAQASYTLVVTMEISSYENKYLTFEALEDGKFWFRDKVVSYSVDNGNTWTELPVNTYTPTINQGEKILLKGNNTNYYSSYGQIRATGNFNAEGNIMSLIYGDDFIDQKSLSGKDWVFRNLFDQNSKLINAENLVLPATTLSEQCYESLFSICSNLVTAPELPATTLAERCYDSMFYATKLVTAPELPATTLAENCYRNMFSGCTLLVNAPELPATTLAKRCYDTMFKNCTSLVNAPELPATTLAENCYGSYNSVPTDVGMFNGCTSLVNAPELPATTLANYCYASMFIGCTSLVNAPELPATTLKTGCYFNMFNACSSLTSAPELPATSLVADCYQEMFQYCNKLNYIKAACLPNSVENKTRWVNGVADTGTYVISDPNYNINDGVRISYSCIPNGWVIKDYQGNTIYPKLSVIFTNSNSLSNNTTINEQFNIPSYQITTSPAAAASEVAYKYSTNNRDWTNTIPEYLDTTKLGTFTYYIKAFIEELSTTYVDKSEVYTYTYTVKNAIYDFSDYVRLDQIENVDSLLDTETLRFNDFVLDLSSSLTNGNNVYVQLRDTVTNQTSDSYNGIRTYSATGSSDFNLRENRNNYKIQNVGDYVSGYTGFYHYHFTNTMQIFAIQSNVNRSKVYFKLPNYTPPIDDYSFSYSGNFTYNDINENGKPQYYGLCGCPSDHGISRVTDFPNTVNIYVDDVLYQEPTFDEGADITREELPPILEITPENEGYHTIKFVLKNQTNAAQSLHDFIKTYFIDCNWSLEFSFGTDVDEEELYTYGYLEDVKLYFSAQYPTSTYATEFEDLLSCCSSYGGEAAYEEHALLDLVSDIYIDSDNAAYYNDGWEDTTIIKRKSDDEQVYPYVEPEEEP